MKSHDETVEAAMSDVNVTLSGYVGSEVEFKEGFNRAGERHAHNDRAFFRLGSTPRFFDRSTGRWRDGETVWLTVKAWRGLAHNVASSLSLGQPVVVVGKLKTSVWKGEDDQVHSRDVLEATVVGHDLNRGTSAFSRTSRPVEQHDPAPEEDDAATMSSLATAPGTSVNTRTGELVEPQPSEGVEEREPEPAF
jgi:single-strand DNA-binding protein